MENTHEYWVVSGFASTGRHTGRELGPYLSLSTARKAAEIVRRDYSDSPACLGVWIIDDVDGDERIVGN